MARSRARRNLSRYSSKRLFVVSTEGYRTEPTYFDYFNHPDRKGDFTIRVLKHRTKTDPEEVLRRLIHFRRQKNPGRDTEYWMVLDKDNWTENQLDSVCAKANKEGVQVALSNPCFEAWLYLHMAQARPFTDAQDCLSRLQGQAASYEKSKYDVSQFTPGLADAVSRAEQLDTNPNTSWPREQGSHMYKLMNQLKKYGLDF